MMPTGIEDVLRINNWENNPKFCRVNVSLFDETAKVVDTLTNKVTGIIENFRIWMDEILRRDQFAPAPFG